MQTCLECILKVISANTSTSVFEMSRHAVPCEQISRQAAQLELQGRKLAELELRCKQYADKVHSCTCLL